MAAALTDASLLDAIDDIRPIIEEHARQGEVDRQLPAPIYEALRDLGFLRMWVPRAFGGLETDPVTAYRVFEEISAIDGSVGWNLNQTATVSALMVLVPDAAEELFADPDVVFGGALWPPGQALRVDGGYRLTGRTPFVSGSQYARWVLNPAAIIDAGEPVTDPDTGQPVLYAVVYEASDAEIVDTWHTMGMRGTGSNDAVATDVFIPEHRAAPVVIPEPEDRAAVFANPLYGAVPWFGIQAHACVPLGVARRAVDTLVDLATTKVPNYHQTPIRERGTAQAYTARAQALLDAARSYLHETITDAMAEDAGGSRLSEEAKIRLQLAAANAATASATAVDLVHRAAGTSGMRCEAGLERLFRDVHTITQHAAIQDERYTSCGQLMFGLETEWFPFHL